MDYEELPLTEFDQETLSESTQMTKALIPFLNFQMQKTLSIIIRFQELMQTIDYFKKPIHQTSGSVFHKSDASMDEILKAVGHYCGKSYAKNFDMILNIMKMTNVVNMYKDMEQNPDFSNIINAVKGMGGFENDTDGSSDSSMHSSDTTNKESADMPHPGNAFRKESQAQTASSGQEHFNSEAKSSTNNSNKTADNHNPSGFDSLLNNPLISGMLNKGGQQDLVKKYMDELDKIDFEHPENIPDDTDDAV